MCLLNIMLFFVISRRKTGDVCHQITFPWMNAFFFLERVSITVHYNHGW